MGIGNCLGPLWDCCLWPPEESRVSSGPWRGPEHRRLQVAGLPGPHTPAWEQEALTDGPRDRHPIGTYLKKSFSGAAISQVSVPRVGRGPHEDLTCARGGVWLWGTCMSGTPSPHGGAGGCCAPRPGDPLSNGWHQHCCPGLLWAQQRFWEGVFTRGPSSHVAVRDASCGEWVRTTSMKAGALCQELVVREPDLGKHMAMDV